MPNWCSQEIIFNGSVSNTASMNAIIAILNTLQQLKSKHDGFDPTQAHSVWSSSNESHKYMFHVEDGNEVVITRDREADRQQQSIVIAAYHASVHALPVEGPVEVTGQGPECCLTDQYWLLYNLVPFVGSDMNHQLFTIRLEFQSKWRPLYSKENIAAMSREYEGVSVLYRFAEQGNAMCGKYKCKNGRVQQEEMFGGGGFWTQQSKLNAVYFSSITNEEYDFETGEGGEQYTGEYGYLLSRSG